MANIISNSPLSAMSDWIRVYRKKIVISLIILSLIIVLIFLLLRFLFEPWMITTIERNIREKSKDYTVSIDHASFSIFSSSIKLSGIEVKTDSPAFEKAKRDSSAFIFIHATIRDCDFKGIALFKAIFHHEMDIDELRISGINTEVVHLKANRSLKQDVRKHLVFSFPFSIKKISAEIDRFGIKKMLEAPDNNYLVITDASFSFSPGAVKKNDTLSGNFFQQPGLRVGELKYVTNDSVHTIQAINITYENSKKTLSADNLLILPNYGETEVSSRKNLKGQRMKLTTGKVSLSNLSIPAYLTDHGIDARLVSIENAKLEMFRDKRISSTLHKKPTVQELVYGFHHHLKIDSLQLKSAAIEYKEYGPESIQPGKVTFNDLNGMITNLTNDTLNKLPDTLTISATSNFMNRSKAAIRLKIPMAPAGDVVLVSGSLSSLNAKDLNQMTENVAFVKMNSGKIKSMRYHFTMNKNHAEGNMILIYDSLDFFFKKKESDDSGIKIKLKNFVANTFIIQSSNPLPGKALREGIISYPRNPNKFIINYTWKSILSGIKSSIGFGESREVRR